MVSRTSSLLGALALIALVLATQGADQTSFEVHRLLQYSSEGSTHGSQKAGVSMTATTVGKTSEYQGSMVVLRVEETELAALKKVRTCKTKICIISLLPQRAPAIVFCSLAHSKPRMFHFKSEINGKTWPLDVVKRAKQIQTLFCLFPASH